MKALLENKGSFVNIKKKRVDMNAELVQDMIDCVNEDWSRQFGLIGKKLGKFEEEWVTKHNVAQAFKELRKANPKFISECFSLCRGKVSCCCINCSIASFPPPTFSMLSLS